MTSNTVLVVDDEPSIRTLVSRVFSLEGYDVVEFATGSEALAALRGGLSAAVVLVDLWMTDMDGADFCNAAARLAEPPTCIILSARTDAEAVGEALGLQAFRKPFDFDELVAAVRVAMPDEDVTSVRVP